MSRTDPQKITSYNRLAKVMAKDNLKVSLTDKFKVRRVTTYDTNYDLTHCDTLEELEQWYEGYRCALQYAKAQYGMCEDE